MTQQPLNDLKRGTQDMRRISANHSLGADR